MSTFTVSYGAPNALGQVTVTVTRVTGTRGETLTITPSGTPTLNSDYTLSATTLSFPQGTRTKTFVIDMTADGIAEPSEVINFRFTSTKSSTAAFTSSFTITDSIECFLPGTLIRTPRGDIPVETLEIGDLILTSDGKAEPVRWVGRHTVSTVFGDEISVLPIRIRAGALEDNVPSRDLLVSPGHAILADGVLIQAGALVNGVSIIRERNVEEVITYYHIELTSHSLIVAENTAAETFVDNVERARFDNYAEYLELYPEEAAIPEMDLPVAMSSRQIPASTRRRLNLRASALYGSPLAAVA